MLLTRTQEIIRQKSSSPSQQPSYGFSAYSETVYIVNTEGEEWHHHRRIVGPPFNEGMNAAVWRTTSDVMLELFKKWEAEISSSSIPVHSLETAMEIAPLSCRCPLLIIGMTPVLTLNPRVRSIVNWKSHYQIPAGHKRVRPLSVHGLSLTESLKSFREALEIVTTNVPLYILPLTWLLNLFPHGRVVVEGFAEMRQCILETAEERRASSSQKRPNDLLSNLVAAADDNFLNGEGGFSESDPVGERPFIPDYSMSELC